MPPYSPLHEVLESLTDLAALHELAEHAPAEHTDAVQERTREALQSLQRSMARVSAAVPQSPMQQALTKLASLEAARRRFEADSDRSKLGQEYLELGRATVEQLTTVVEAAIQRERQL